MVTIGDTYKFNINSKDVYWVCCNMSHDVNPTGFVFYTYNKYKDHPINIKLFDDIIGRKLYMGITIKKLSSIMDESNIKGEFIQRVPVKVVSNMNITFYKLHLKISQQSVSEGCLYITDNEDLFLCIKNNLYNYEGFIIRHDHNHIMYRMNLNYDSKLKFIKKISKTSPIKLKDFEYFYRTGTTITVDDTLLDEWFNLKWDDIVKY